MRSLEAVSREPRGRDGGDMNICWAITAAPE